MNTKTDDMGSQSEDGIPDVPKSVLVGISREHHPENDSPIMTLKDVLDAVGSPDDWSAFNTPSSSSDQSGVRRSPAQRQVASLMDSYAKATGDLAERKTSHHELVTDSVAAESNLATCTENQRFEQQIWFAGAATESVRHQANQELAVTETMAALEYEKIKLFRDHARRELSEARAQLAAIEARGHDHSSCQEFQSLESENRAARSQIKGLEAELQHLIGELKEAQGLVTGYKNSFAITDKILNEQHAEIAEQKVEIARLSIQVAELQGVPESSSDNDEVEEKTLEDLIEHTRVVEHPTSGHPLVMRIDVWVGGEYGTDTELALVKMNPDTPFKVVLEDLRHHHPLMALKQKCTGRYIFESDTPAHLGVKDGEEFVFIQQNDEPNFMLLPWKA